MTTQAAELHYAVRFAVVCRYLGQLCLAIAFITLVPLLVALASYEPAIALRYAVVVTVLLAMGLLARRLRPPHQYRVQENEAIVLTALVFLLTPLLMSYPIMASGLSFIDSLFETVSGITTTGLSTVLLVEEKSRAFLFARAWQQWAGGLGIVVLSLAFLPQQAFVAKRLALAEGYQDDLVGGTKAHARRMVWVYSAITLAGVGLLMLFGADLFDAVLYSLASVSTGGFAPHNQSLAGLGGWPLQAAVTLLCFSCAISLPLYHQSLHKGWRILPADLQVRALLLVATMLTLFLALTMHRISGLPWPQVLRHAPLLAFSAQTTTGFATLDLAALDGGSKLLVILAMAVGGGIGSTAGGFKIMRLLILLRLLYGAVVRAGLPRHAVYHLRLEESRLEEPEIRNALLIILLYVMVIILSWLVFVLHGYDPLNALFEVVSAVGTVGLSVGVTSSELPALLKGVLCLDMLMGRLEIFCWLIVFYPKTWIGKRVEV